MKVALVLAGSLLIALAPAQAAKQITAGEFLSRAEPLMKKSKAALLFSGEARRLMRAVREAAETNRARWERERASGKQLTTCLPPKGKARIEPGELIAHLRSLAPAQRAQSFNAAFAGAMSKKYPCKR